MMEHLPPRLLPATATTSLSVTDVTWLDQLGLDLRPRTCPGCPWSGCTPTGPPTRRRCRPSTATVWPRSACCSSAVGWRDRRPAPGGTRACARTSARRVADRHLAGRRHRGDGGDRRSDRPAHPRGRLAAAGAIRIPNYDGPRSGGLGLDSGRTEGLAPWETRTRWTVRRRTSPPTRGTSGPSGSQPTPPHRTSTSLPEDTYGDPAASWPPPAPAGVPRTGSHAVRGRRSSRGVRAGAVIAVAALTALLVGGVAGYGGALLAGRGEPATAPPTAGSTESADGKPEHSARWSHGHRCRGRTRPARHRDDPGRTVDRLRFLDGRRGSHPDQQPRRRRRGRRCDAPSRLRRRPSSDGHAGRPQSVVRPGRDQGQAGGLPAPAGDGRLRRASDR